MSSTKLRVSPRARPVPDRTSTRISVPSACASQIPSKSPASSELGAANAGVPSGATPEWRKL